MMAEHPHLASPERLSFAIPLFFLTHVSHPSLSLLTPRFSHFNSYHPLLYSLGLRPSICRAMDTTLILPIIVIILIVAVLLGVFFLLLRRNKRMTWSPLV